MTETRSNVAAQAAPWCLALWLVAVHFSTAAAEILLGLCVVLAAAALWRGGPGARSFFEGGPRTAAVPWLFLALILLIVFSSVFAVDRTASLGKIHKLIRYALVFCALAVPWSNAAWRRMLLMMMAMTVALAVQGTLTLVAGWGRAATPELHYNTLAQVAAMLSLFFAAGVLYGPRMLRRWPILLVFFALLATAILYATLARAAMLGWLSALVLLVVFRLSRRTLLVAVALLAVVAGSAFTVLQSQRSDVTDLNDTEFTRRYDMWRMAGEIIADRPLLGIGAGSMETVYDAYKTGALVGDDRRWTHVHNDLLEIALTHGIPAALVWLALLVVFHVAAAKQLLLMRRDGIRSWARAGLAGSAASLHCFYVCGMLHDNFVIYVKIGLMLFLWGHFTAGDRSLAAGAPEEGR